MLKTQTETLEIEKNLTKKNKNRPIEDYFQKTATHRRNQSKMPNWNTRTLKEHPRKAKKETDPQKITPKKATNQRNQSKMQYLKQTTTTFPGVLKKQWEAERKR